MNRREALRWATVALGGIVSPGLLSATMADAKPSGKATKIYSLMQKNQIAVLAELIIPVTDVPGAIEAGVPEFIEMMVEEWYTDTERKIFFQGLIDIDRYTQREFQCGLIQCDTTQMTEALTHFETEANSYIAPAKELLSMDTTDENSPFFSKIKELTIVGYFTSEIGVTQAMTYNPIPMEYKGDIALTDVGNKQWAPY